MPTHLSYFLQGSSIFFRKKPLFKLNFHHYFSLLQCPTLDGIYCAKSPSLLPKKKICSINIRTLPAYDTMRKFYWKTWHVRHTEMKHAPNFFSFSLILLLLLFSFIFYPENFPFTKLRTNVLLCVHRTLFVSNLYVFVLKYCVYLIYIHLK